MLISELECWWTNFNVEPSLIKLKSKVLTIALRTAKLNCKMWCWSFSSQMLHSQVECCDLLWLLAGWNSKNVASKRTGRGLGRKIGIVFRTCRRQACLFDWLLACVAWRFWLGALSNKGGRGQRNREEIGAEARAASPLVLAREAREFRCYAAPAPSSTKPPCYAG